MERRYRSRFGRAAIVRAAALIFVLTGLLVGVVVLTLDRNARRGNEQQTATELASAARVSASLVSNVRANVRGRAGELATSLALQRAVLARRTAQLKAFARAHDVHIVAGGRVYGTLPPLPRLAASAAIVSGGRVLARVTTAIALDRALLRSVQAVTPLPDHAVLVFANGDRIVAGGPSGASAVVREGHTKLGSVDFFAASARLPALHGASILALEPAAAVDVRIAPYRRRLFFSAILTLALAAAFAARLARPVARVLADLARLSRQAQTDALTGLANRRALDERLDYEVEHARRLGTNVSFVLADIDNFKSINDTHGHQTGDDVLRAVARVFADSVRELDLPARFGGEEIALVLPGTQLAGARRLAERIRHSVSELEIANPDGEPVRVTASFGAACFPTYGGAAGLVAAADASLYEAKRSGKNCVVTATARKKAAATGTTVVAET